MTFDQFILMLTLWREARGTTHNGRAGIASVIRNRVAIGGWWGNTISQVCTHRYQFSGMTAPGDPNLIQWPAATDPITLDCIAIASVASPDITGGALYYYTAPLTAPPVNAWGPTTLTAVIDGIYFCKPVPTPAPYGAGKFNS